MWPTAESWQPATLADLQTLLDHFADAYNHHRPHRSLPRRATPAACLPKALPDGSREADAHTRVGHNRVDTSGVVTLRVNGRLHHIGIGRTHVSALIPYRPVAEVSAFLDQLPDQLPPGQIGHIAGGHPVPG